MNKTPPEDVTQLLSAWSHGDQAALQKLSLLIETELHRMAQGYLMRERPGHTVQATALVNEVYLRLMDWKNASWQNRVHFLGVTAQLMRRVLVDHARRHHYLKRGGGAVKVSLEEGALVSSARDADVIALDDALERLTAIDPRKSRIVEMRFFGGLNLQETAEALEISPRTARREWSLAQAWLLS